MGQPAVPYELSVCLRWLFAEAGEAYDERIRAAADDGVTAVEMWGWREHDLSAIGRALAQTSTTLTALVTDPLSRLVDPEAAGVWLGDLGESVAVAADLGAPYLVVIAGDALPAVPREHQHLAVLDALRRAADIVSATPVTLLLEPLNSVFTRSYLDRTAEAVELVRAVDSPSVRVLYDLYHSLVMGEDARATLTGRMDRVAHIQFADLPARSQPGTGTVDWPAMCALLRELGYAGRIGLECHPADGTADPLRHIRSALAGI